MCLTDYFNSVFGITQDDNVVSLVIKLKRFTKVMSKNYQPGDRVIEKFQGRSGELIKPKDNTLFTLRHAYIVRLDEQGTEEEILEKDLEVEHLTRSEIDTETTKLKNLVKEEANKISDKIAGKIVKELPEHLSYLQKALDSQEKSESENEYTYIEKEMERAFNSKLVEKNISLKKLKHCWKKSLK